VILRGAALPTFGLRDREADWSERQEVLDGARAMLREGLVVGMVGNVSRRVGNRILITPSRVPYPRMGPADVVAVDLEAGHSRNEAIPSTELPVHLAIYRKRPDVNAVIHTHSSHAVAWSFLGEPLLPLTEENRYYGIGIVQTTPAAAAGSEELAQAVADVQADASAVLLGEHGVLAWGPSVDAVLDVARGVERQAEIAWILRQDNQRRRRQGA
jgi:L-fuculose-phosphate aldolase